MNTESALQDLDDEEDAAYEERLISLEFDYDYIFSNRLVRGNPSSDCDLPDSLKREKGRKTRWLKFKEPLSIFFFLLFAGIGLEFELGHLSQQEFSQSAGRDLVLNLSVLAAIIIPLYLFSKRLAKQLSVPTYVLWIAMFGGAFVAGWLSFSGNSDWYYE